MYSVEVENLSYQYPTEDKMILKNISLKVKKGEFCSIVGANGSGKTTLCNAIRGFVPKFYKGTMEGSVKIHGKDIADKEIGDLATEIGFVFQNPFTQISGVADTVYDELAYGLENLGISPDEIHKRVEKILKLTKTEQFRDRNPYQLSGGQQQRVALAAILVMEQDILVIDEPTSQLDPQSTKDVFDIIQIMRDMGKTIILVEHKMEEIAKYSDHVVVMDDGKIVMEGTPKEVFTNPKCEQYKLRLPQCTVIGTHLIKENIDLQELPITVEDTVKQIKNYINGERK